MTVMKVAAPLAMLLALAACGNPSHREWTATDSSATLAFDACDEEVDTTMRLRGYPVNPLPETPQASYRKEIFAQCMRRRGYED
jgi:ABC-type glycerol-3-phosphate transport system substrate-binding protein